MKRNISVIFWGILRYFSFVLFLQIIDVLEFTPSHVAVRIYANKCLSLEIQKSHTYAPSVLFIVSLSYAGITILVLVFDYY